jgi:predicted DNA-binding transcriptional regulator YafY
MRGKQLLQMLKALELLSLKEGATIRGLANGLSITTRSVYRLLDTMQEAGFPIWDEKILNEKEKRWHIENDYLCKLPNVSLPDLKLTYPEIISLYLLKRDNPIFRGTDIERYMRSSFYKISSSFPEELQPLLKRLGRIVVSKSISGKKCSGMDSILRTVTNAAVFCESVLICYNSFYDNRTKEMVINPLHFFENHGGFYLIAQKNENREIRVLAVERILSAERTGIEFDYPDDFNPESLLDSAFDIIADKSVEVKILFSKEQARYVSERQWSHEQKIIENQDGSILCCLRTSGRRDIKKWVLSWGNDAVLLEPEDLAQEIREELKKMYKNYS